MKKNGAQIIVELLERYGIGTVAGIPGGSILPLYDELSRSSIRHILVRQEQAGGFIAQGIARTTGRPAVCLATSGPGAMNLLTAIADARSDSIPVIAITGQVNTYLIGTDAFQEADTFGLSFPITKHSIMVKSPAELLTAVPEAFAIAVNGRPGPVLIDVPRDVQLAECEFDAYPDVSDFCGTDESCVRFHTKPEAMPAVLEAAAALIAAARRPVLYLGGGCNSPQAAQSAAAFLKQCRMPAVCSLMGLGCVPADSGDFAGMVGMHGSYAANAAMHGSDLVIAAGARFDDRATGSVPCFCPDAKIIHIDIDAAEVNKILPAAVSIVAKAEGVLPELARILSERKAEQCAATEGAKREWADSVAAERKQTASDSCGSPAEGGKRTDFAGSANPRTFIRSVPQLAERAGTPEGSIIVTTDVGQHQMWAAQYYPVKRPRTFLTSGSLGTMGFGLPAAIGAALANPDKRVVCFSGDGSIMMNIQELATLAELNLAVTVIVFENGTLGMVYQQQKYLFNKTYSACEFQASPDLLKIAEGFGIEAADADADPGWYKRAFDPERGRKPFFVRVRIDPEEDVLPFVPGGKANIDSIR